MRAVTRTAPLSDVLAALARELDMLAGMGRLAQEAVSPLLTMSRNPDDGPNLQQLDLLTQHLEELGPFLDALARFPPETCHVDVETPTTQMRLTDLACRLRCEPGPETSSAVFAAGDAEWF